MRTILVAGIITVCCVLPGYAEDFTASTYSVMPESASGMGFERVCDVSSEVAEEGAVSAPEDTNGIVQAVNTAFTIPPTLRDEESGLTDAAASALDPAVPVSFANLPSSARSDATMDNMILLLSPPYSSPDDIETAVSILKPIVSDAGIQVSVKEQIGRVMLDIAVQQDLDTDIRTEALNDVLYWVVNDRDVNPVFKEETAEQMLDMVTNELKDPLARPKLKEAAFDILIPIASDQDVKESVKESMVPAALGVLANPDLEASSFGVLLSVAEDPDVYSGVKESLADSLLTVVNGALGSNEDTALAGTLILATIYSDEDVSAASREKMVQPMLDIVTAADSSVGMRFFAQSIMGNAMSDPDVQASEKEKILNSVGQWAFVGDLTEEENEALFMKSLITVAYGFLDQDVSAEIKDRSIPNMIKALSSDEIPGLNLKDMVICSLGAAAQDPEVSAAVKENMIQPLEDFLKQISEESGSSDGWYEAVVDTLGVLTTIRNDEQVSQAAKDGITAWIETAGYLNETTQPIWDEFNVLVVASDERILEEETVMRGVWNVLEALPVYRPPHMISLALQSEYGVTGYYTELTDVMELAVGEYSLKKFEESFFHEIGHYLDLTGQLSSENRTKLDQLWTESTEMTDFVRPYGAEARAEDFGTLVQAYFASSKNLLDTAVFLAGNEKLADNTRLKKVEVMADIFSHTRDDRTKSTYVFEIELATGAISRKEVALTEQIINGKSYYLPDLERVFEDMTFDHQFASAATGAQ